MIQEDPYLHWVLQIECIHVPLMLRRALSSLQGHPVPGPTYYVDGGSKQGQGKYGFWRSDGVKLVKESEGSNQELEKRAMLLALQEGPPIMNIVTDSQYVYTLIEARPLPVNIEEPLLRTILEAIESKEEIYIQWVPGHKGIPGNENIDKLVSQINTTQINLVVQGGHIKEKEPEQIGYSISAPKRSGTYAKGNRDP